MHGLPDGVIFFLSILVLIYGILMFLLPFFVFQIRNQIIKQNQLLEQIAANTRKPGTQRTAVDPLIKRCSSCGAKNRRQDHTCMSCGKPI